MASSKGSSSPGTSGAPKGTEWATQGYTVVEPTDPSPSLGDSDILRDDGRESNLPERAASSTKFQRGDMKPLKSKDV